MPEDSTLADLAESRAAGSAFKTATQKESQRLTAPLKIVTKPQAWWSEDRRVLPKHAWIPDVQAKTGVRLEHLRQAAQYLCEKKPDVVVLAMDWWDFPSLSFHDKARADYLTRSTMADFRAGLHAWDTFFQPFRDARAATGYWPTFVCVEGNHDALIWRFLQEDARADEAFPTPRQVAEAEGCLWYPFLTPVNVDGVVYCHYFANPMTGRPYGGMMETRLKTIGCSFTMGHQQTYLVGVLPRIDGSMLRGLVAGAFYQHDEDYKGTQGNHHWRGIVLKHAVHEGNYNLMEVDLPFLRRRYGGPAIVARGDYAADLGWAQMLKDRVRVAEPPRTPRKKKR